MPRPAQRSRGREIERILPIDDYRHSADPSQVHPGAVRTCQDIKTTGCSFAAKCVWPICTDSRTRGFADVSRHGARDFSSSWRIHERVGCADSDCRRIDRGPCVAAGREDLGGALSERAQRGRPRTLTEQGARVLQVSTAWKRSTCPLGRATARADHQSRSAPAVNEWWCPRSGVKVPDVGSARLHL